MTTAAACAALTALAGTAPAEAGTPVGPRQHFIGLVNGSDVEPVVHTFCPGPIWEGRRGSVIGSQTLAVARVKDGGGYTASSSTIHAWVEQDPSAEVAFTQYGVSSPFPKGIQVPCDGDGTVRFDPCALQQLCIAITIPDIVKVKFVNIAD